MNRLYIGDDQARAISILRRTPVGVTAALLEARGIGNGRRVVRELVAKGLATRTPEGHVVLSAAGRHIAQGMWVLSCQGAA